MKKDIIIVLAEIICIIILCIIIHSHDGNHRVSRCSEAFNCKECSNGLCKCDYSLEDGTVAKEKIMCRVNNEKNN